MTISADIPKPQRGSEARNALMRRLIDTVALPSSRLSPQDRSLAGDVLIEMLFQAEDADRELCAKRLREATDAPRRVLRYLAHCSVDVAAPILEENRAYDASDLRDLIATTTVEHAIIIARRKHVPVSVSDALIETENPQVIRTLLNNSAAEISELGMDLLIELSKQAEEYCALIVNRPELTPSQAMAMFWWSDGPTRKIILTKHAADRMVLIDLCSDIFSRLTQEDWQDPLARKTIQVIERRQRNRAALERSEFASLEEAVRAAALTGMTPHVMQEIGYLAGIKPVSMAKIMSDLGGEAIAVLCKATGLKRPSLTELWRAMRRPVEIESGKLHPQLAYVLEIFDMMTVVKAQTVLRYWNWSLTSSGKPSLTANDEDAEDSFSSTRRTAKLVFSS